MKKLFTKNKNNKGYTIIETMIAVSVFLVVVVSGLGALLNANVVYNKTQDMRSILDNLNFIMEDMSRNMRTGYMFRCFQNGVNTELTSATISAQPNQRSCGDGWAVAFEATQPIFGNPAVFNDQYVYYIALDNSVTPPVGRIWKSTDGLTTSAIQLTPNEVVINTVASSFSVLGAEVPTGVGGGNQQQPLITFRLVGEIIHKNITTPFSLQTSVSQRLLDVPQ